MDKITKGKILVGSSLKDINKAKIYGHLDLKEVYLFNLISNLESLCSLNNSLELSNDLNKKLRDLQNKYPSICNYRKRNSNSYENLPNFNLTVRTSNDPTVEGFDCYNYEYEPFSFTEDLFLTNYTGDEEAKFLKINTLPALGNLTFNGEPVTLNQIILLSEVSNLEYDLNLEYSQAVNVTFDYQIGTGGLNSLYTDSVTFVICVPENSNTAPTVADNTGGLNDDICRIFVNTDFVKDFTDPDIGDEPDEVRIITLPSVGTLEYEGNTFTTPFTFDVEETGELKFCLPEEYTIIDGVIYEYDEPLVDLLQDAANDGFTVDSIVNGTYNLSREDVEQITSTTNIYAFFDATSMQIDDAIDAKAALQTWFDDFKSGNNNYTGNLYIISTYNERWVQYGTAVQTGSINVVNGGQWISINNLPPNLNTPQWVPETDAVVLAFVDETTYEYHDKDVSGGFAASNGPVPDSDDDQPKPKFIDDFVEFRDLYPNFNFFRGLIYPIVQDLEGQGGCLVLQSMAAIEGKILSQFEINAYDTDVDVSILTTENPYANFPIPNTNPQEFLEPLSDYNWKGVFNKTSPASAVFNSTVFADDLNEFLAGSTEVTVVTDQIVGTLVTDQPITFTFQTSDDDVNDPLFSNVATYTITYDDIDNRPPSQVGDGFKIISNNETVIFDREDFTSELNPVYLDPENDAAFKLLIETLPQEGVLTLNDIPIVAGTEVLFSDIDNNLFKFIPNSNINNYTINFNFKIADAGSGEFVG